MRMIWGKIQKFFCAKVFPQERILKFLEVKKKEFCLQTSNELYKDYSHFLTKYQLNIVSVFELL
jgi:hypothetical protein